MQTRQFRDALEVMRESEPDTDDTVAEQFWNGGFEKPIEMNSARSFHWLLNSKNTVRMGIDTQAHSGNGSLRLVFSAPNQLDTIPVSQTIVVQPNTQYHFECYLRTEDLVSASTPMLVIFDATSEAALAKSSPAPTGTNGWQRVTLDFKTSPTSDAVILRMVMTPCGEDQTCPIFGTIWYDDFQLQRGGGAPSSRGSASNGKR